MQLRRSRVDGSVTISWSPPEGAVDAFTVQRQQLVTADGSSFFANIITVGGGMNVPGDTYSFEDSGIFEAGTYEYRVAAIKDEVVGQYSDWFRTTPVAAVFGHAPDDFRFVAAGSRLLDDRREYWMGWDPLGGADDYEVGVVVYDVAGGGQTMESNIVTDPLYFRTAYGRVDLRVRGRKQDDDLCGSGAGDLCYSDWTGWYSVRFTPKVTIAASVIPTPVPAGTPAADASIVELRANTAQAIEAGLGAAGAPVNAGVVMQFVAVLTAAVLGAMSVASGWRVGAQPLGVGMAFAIAILVLFTFYRLYGIPWAWPVALQAVLASAGAFALARQTGVFR